MRRAKNFKVKLELKNKRGERLFNKRPAVLAYAFLAAGIWAASAALWNYRARTIMALVALVVSAAMLALKKKGLAVLCGFFLLGELLFAGTADVYESRTFDAEGAEVAARIVSDYDMAQSRYHYVADNVYVNGKKVKGKIVVSYTEGNLPLGAVVKFSADVKSRKFSTHWNSVNNFRKKEYYSATTDSVEIAEITSVPIYDKMRYEIKKNLYTTLRSDTADIITPLLLGDTRVINDNLRHDVSAAGLAHLFAVSGFAYRISGGRRQPSDEEAQNRVPYERSGYERRSSVLRRIMLLVVFDNKSNRDVRRLCGGEAYGSKKRSAVVTCGGRHSGADVISRRSAESWVSHVDAGSCGIVLLHERKKSQKA